MRIIIIYLSDITNASGTRIDHPYHSGPSSSKPRRLSHLRWPMHSPSPTKQQWNIWTAMLQSTVCTPHFALHHPIGPWLQPTHQLWPVISSGDDNFYFINTPTSTSHSLLPIPSKTRQHKYLISNPTIIDRSITHVASYTIHNRHITISTIGLSPPPYTTPPPQTTPFLWKLKHHDVNAPPVATQHNDILSYLQHRKYSTIMLSALSTYFPSPAQIEWAGLHRYLLNITVSSRAAFVKFQQQWLPTKHHLHQLYPSTQDPRCPHYDITMRAKHKPMSFAAPPPKPPRSCHCQDHTHLQS